MALVCHRPVAISVRPVIVPQPVAQLRRVGIGTVESQDPLDIAFREALFFRQFIVKLASEPGNDGGTPSFLPLTGVNHVPNVPIQPHQFGIYRKHGAGCAC